MACVNPLTLLRGLLLFLRLHVLPILISAMQLSEMSFSISYHYALPDGFSVNVELVDNCISKLQVLS